MTPCAPAWRPGQKRPCWPTAAHAPRCPRATKKFFAAAGKGVELMYMVFARCRCQTADGGAAVTFVRNRLVEKPGEARRGFEPCPAASSPLNAAQVVFAIGKKADAALVAGTPDRGHPARGGHQLLCGRRLAERRRHGCGGRCRGQTRRGGHGRTDEVKAEAAARHPRKGARRAGRQAHALCPAAGPLRRRRAVLHAQRLI